MPQQICSLSTVTAPGNIEVWLVDLKQAGSALAELEARTPRLSAEEHAWSAGNGHFERMHARIALRLLIERFAGPGHRGAPIERSRHGRPCLAGATVDFSLAHVAGHALIAMAGSGPVGVDLEAPREVRLEPRRRAAIEAAASALSPGAELPDPALPGNARFLQAWVRLEALAKADGRGIGHVLTSLGIVGSAAWVAAADVRNRVAHIFNERDLQVLDLNAGSGLFAAVAFPAGRRVRRIESLPPRLEELERLAT